MVPLDTHYAISLASKHLQPAASKGSRWSNQSLELKHPSFVPLLYRPSPWRFSHNPNVDVSLNDFPLHLLSGMLLSLLLFIKPSYPYRYPEHLRWCLL